MVAKQDSRAATTSPVHEKPKMGASLLDALKDKMRISMEAKIKASKDAWANLDNAIESDGGTNSQADHLDYSKSILTVNTPEHTSERLNMTQEGLMVGSDVGNLKDSGRRNTKQKMNNSKSVIQTSPRSLTKTSPKAKKVQKKKSNKLSHKRGQS